MRNGIRAAFSPIPRENRPFVKRGNGTQYETPSRKTLFLLRKTNIFPNKKAGETNIFHFLNLYYVALISFVLYAFNARMKHPKHILRDRSKDTEHVASIFRYPRLSCN